MISMTDGCLADADTVKFDFCNNLLSSLHTIGLLGNTIFLA